MIIYGTKTRSKELWTGVMPCQHCEKNTWHIATEYRKWFSLFFIPLIPYRQHLIFTCRACGYSFELKPEYEARFRNLLAGRPVVKTGIVEEMASSAEPMVTQPEVKPVPNRRRKGWFWICVVIVSIIFVAIVAFAVRLAGMLPPPTVTPAARKYISYTNETLGIAVDIPQGWENIQDTDKPESPLFTAPDGSMSVGMAIIPTPAGSELVDVIDFSHLFYEYEVLESRTDIVIQGHKAAMTRVWARGRRDIEEFKNLEVTQIFLGIELNGSILLFTFIGDETTELVQLYKDMVSTIEFLNEGADVTVISPTDSVSTYQGPGITMKYPAGWELEVDLDEETIGAYDPSYCCWIYLMWAPSPMPEGTDAETLYRLEREDARESTIEHWGHKEGFEILREYRLGHGPVFEFQYRDEEGILVQQRVYSYDDVEARRYVIWGWASCDSTGNDAFSYCLGLGDALFDLLAQSVTFEPTSTSTPTVTDKPVPPTSTSTPIVTDKPVLPTRTPSPTTTPTPVIYVVKAGDTLSAIAKEFGVTVKALQEVNAISDPNRLQIGQELVIPQGRP